MFDITTDPGSTVIKIHSARGYNLIGPVGTNGQKQVVRYTVDGIKFSAPDSTEPVRATPLVAGFVRRLTNAIGPTISNRPVECVIEPVDAKPYDCMVTLPPVADENQMAQLCEFLESEDGPS